MTRQFSLDKGDLRIIVLFLQNLPVPSGFFLVLYMSGDEAVAQSWQKVASIVTSHSIVFCVPNNVSRRRCMVFRSW